MVQEVEHSEVQLEHSSGVEISVDKAIKQVVIKKVPQLLAVACWHAVIKHAVIWNKMLSPVGSTAIATGAAEMPRNGIG